MRGASAEFEMYAIQPSAQNDASERAVDPTTRDTKVFHFVPIANVFEVFLLRHHASMR